MKESKKIVFRINALHVRSGLRSGSVDNPQCIHCINDCYHSQSGTNINACLDKCIHTFCTRRFNYKVQHELFKNTIG
jgi:hypothetical protein